MTMSPVGERGVTLIETLLVLAAMAAAVGLAWPRHRPAAPEPLTPLLAARLAAVREARTVRLDNGAEFRADGTAAPWRSPDGGVRVGPDGMVHRAI